MQLILSKISHPASCIPNPASGIQHPVSIKNIIFDFGGVICNIDVKVTEKRFAELGLQPGEKETGYSGSSHLFEYLEAGRISISEFHDGLRKFFTHTVTDEQLDEAWNALLLDIPAPRIRLLEVVRKNYRIFMLTNTNEIHYLKYAETFRNQYGYKDFDALFDKAYFSYRIGLIKPDAAIFSHVIHDSLLEPSETLFIDDTLEHVKSANSLGIHAHHLQIGKGEQIMELFTTD